MVRTAVVAGLVVASACGGTASKQTPECVALIACVETLGLKVNYGSTHGPNGSCWSGTQAQADACTATCKTSLAELKASHADAGCT